jgi:hypothetical protein
MENTFKLSDLDEDFWNKVIFIQIQHSSGLGGPGVIWLITEERKQYVIGITDMPFEEYELEKLNGLFEVHFAEDRYVYEAESRGFKFSRKGRVLVKEEYFEQYEKMWQKVYDADVSQIHYVDEAKVMCLVLGDEEMQRFDLVDSVKRREKEQERYERMKEEHERKKLTAENFDWKPLYYNNRYCRCWRENGLYCLFLKEVNGKIVGSRYSIVYQLEEIEPFGHKSDAAIELYIVFEKKYGVIEGKLTFNDPKSRENEVDQYCDSKDTLNDHDLNHPGDFVRAFATLEEAKKYAIEVADRGGFDKENILRV